MVYNIFSKIIGYKIGVLLIFGPVRHMLKNIFHKIIGIHAQIRVQAFILDLPAKSAFLNVNQFNGYYGCVACHESGNYLDDKMIYLPNGKEV